MKLSDLVYYRNTLDTIDIARVKQTALAELDHVRYLVAETGIELHDFADSIQQQYRTAAQGIDDLAQVLVDLRANIDQRIEYRQDEYFKESLRLYEQEMCWETNDYILNRRLAIDDASKEVLESRLKAATDWRIPGMILRPGHEDFIENLVPMDPLYLVDHDQALLDPVLDKFNSVYRNRLRPYVISESDNAIFGQLPHGQFGLIFAYNFFNYKPMEVVQRYLGEMFDLLRPGGTLLFTFNNCDRGHGVALAEHSFMCYTPQSRLVRLAENVGLDLTHQYTGLQDLSWLEFKRPGKIETMRGNQPLAKIVRK